MEGMSYGFIIIFLNKYMIDYTMSYRSVEDLIRHYFIGLCVVILNHKVTF